MPGNLYKRPMFRKGGSAEGGITSGLKRQRYADGSSKQRLIDAMGMAPPRRNFNDFLINFGLDIASRSPQGNIFQTAALAAKDPYSQFSKRRDAEQNLMRQVGLEAETMDINAERAAKAAKAERDFKASQLDKKIQADLDLYQLEKGESLDLLIDARAQESIADGKYNNYTAATNEAEWTFRDSKNYADRVIGGVLSEKQSTDPKSKAQFAKKQGKKNGVGKIYYDPYKDVVLEVAVVEGDYVLRPVGSGDEIMDTVKEVVKEEKVIKPDNPYSMFPGTKKAEELEKQRRKDSAKSFQNVDLTSIGDI